MIDYFVFVFIFVCGYFSVLCMALIFNSSIIRISCLYLWHSIFCLIYSDYVINYGGDAVYYFEMSKDSGLEFSFGSDGVIFITSILNQFLGLSFYSISLIFSLFGMFAIIIFDSTLRSVVADRTRFVKNLVLIVVFMPSVHFWSVGLGKDSFSLLSASMALWSSFSIYKRFPVFFCAFFLMLMVRPHIAGIMLIAYVFAFIFDRRVSIFLRYLLLSVSFLSLIILVPFVLEYAGVDGLDLTTYVEVRQSFNMEGSGSVDISSMGFVEQIFTYLFRPTIFEVFSFPSLLTAVDNMLILAIVICGVVGLVNGGLPHPLINKKFVLFYSFFSLIVLALTTANIGISIRQKWMFMPMIIVFFLSISRRYK